MNKKDKDLLLKDLCARLPYNIVINCTEDDDKRTNFKCFFTGDMVKDIQNEVATWNIKPYLRPMSSMTEEERKYLQKLPFPYDFVDWLNAHHFDYRNLIEKGLALEATTEMYK